MANASALEQPGDLPRPIAIRTADGGWLAGSLYGDDAAVASGCGVLGLHGFTGNRMETRRLYVKLGRRLAARGIAMLTFDYRGNGESSGDFSEMSFATISADATAAQDYLFRLLGGEGKARLALTGFSLGGLVATWLLAQRPAQLAAAALWAPVALPEVTLGRILRQPVAEALATSNTIFPCDGWDVGRQFVEDVRLCDGAKWLSSVARPVRFFQSRDDQSVEFWQLERFISAMNEAGRPYELRVFGEGGHCFVAPGQADVLLGETEDFLVRHLLPPASK